MLDRSGIRDTASGYGDIIVVTAPWDWVPSDSALTATRMSLLARYRTWIARLEGLFPHPTPDVAERLREAGGLVARWLERPDVSDYELPGTVGEAKQILLARTSDLRRLIDLATDGAGSRLRLIPDTNALLGNPDLASYARSVGTSEFDVHFVPMVLRELDQLKDRAPSPEVREKAQAVIRRLKGLRDRGSLAAGVTLTRGITVLTEAAEVDPSLFVSWLDASVPDDRILGSALALQVRHPGSPVVLVTSDLNLQNKADAVGASYVETPPNPASLRATLKPEVGSRRSREAGFVRIVTLTNAGPKAARNVEYQLESVDGVFPRTKSGPWRLDRLDAGQQVVQDIIMMAGDEAVIRASWSDDLGTHEQKWTQSFDDQWSA